MFFRQINQTRVAQPWQEVHHQLRGIISVHFSLRQRAKMSCSYFCHNSFKMDFSVSTTDDDRVSAKLLKSLTGFLRGLICSQQETPCLKRRWLCTAVSSIRLVPHIKNEQGAFSCSFFSPPFFPVHLDGAVYLPNAGHNCLGRDKE